MNEYLSIENQKRREIAEKIKEILEKNEGIVFAFIFGSFLDSPSFRDIDIGVYVKNINKDEIPNYELKISKEIANKCGLSLDIFDAKILNFAPSSFLNNIFDRGKLLFSNDNKLLTDLIEDTSLDTILNEHIVNQSLKELVPE